MSPNKKWGKKAGIWTLVVILALVLVGLFYIETMRQRTITKQLKKEAELTQTNNSSVKEDNGEDAEEAKAKTEAEKAQAEKEKAEKEAAEKKKAEAEKKTIALSFRGDSFNADGADKGGGYPARLNGLLAADNIEGAIQDQTWDMAGTLSQMRLAGVSEETVNAYIAAHQAAAAQAGVQPALTEIQVRADLGDFYVDRTDKDMIPVICMGYNGGYGGDVNQLIEQQQHILNTYNKKDQYLILGCYPNGWTDGAAYDQAMTDHWGEHYLSLNSSMGAVDLSDTQRQQIAEALYKKLQELKYI